MSQHSYLIVGDSFSSFADDKRVLTVSQLIALTRLPNCLFEGKQSLILGQGVRQEDIDSILAHYDGMPEHLVMFEIGDLRRVNDRAHSRLSHKHHPHNTLIGNPQKVAEDHFRLSLNIDERCELMSDHQTGQHVQGMILMEAFRQSFLAVTEEFFPLGSEPVYFVINEMSSEFKRFVFPVAAHLEYKVLEYQSRPGSARHSVTVSAIQNDEECASARIRYTVYPDSVIAEKEAGLAIEATSRALAAKYLVLPKKYDAGLTLSLSSS